MLEKGLILMLLKIVHKIETDVSFYVATLSLTPEPHKDSRKNYSPISLINICAKILNKIFVSHS